VGLLVLYDRPNCALLQQQVCLSDGYLGVVTTLVALRQIGIAPGAYSDITKVLEC